jgi:hypothetical protein
LLLYDAALPPEERRQPLKAFMRFSIFPYSIGIAVIFSGREKGR